MIARFVNACGPTASQISSNTLGRVFAPGSSRSTATLYQRGERAIARPASMSSDLSGWTISTLLFPLQERLKGHSTVPLRRSMEQSQWWPREKLLELQSQRLRALIQTAARNVPYYQDLFRESG